jgi:2-polyprenyl-3-methyl-5-hydroxy-6-metoxy-1,4-benzoquinol methylase
MSDVNGPTEISFMNAICPKCRRESPLKFRVGDRNRRITNDVFNYYRCPTCAIQFVSPIPDNLGRYYESDYYDIPDSLETLAVRAEPERFKIDIVRRFASGGRLLEIGPAWGNFSYLAKRAGFKVDAIELDEQCCQFLNGVVGIRAMHTGNIENTLHDIGTYDVIALWHVIEHLPDPWTVLNLMAQKLNPGGVIVIAAPNPEAFQFRILGRYWAHIDAPRHLELIPSQALINHGRDLGLSALLVTTTDQGSLGWNMFGWAVSLEKLSQYGPLARLLHFIGRVIGRLVKSIETKEGLGSAYTVVLRKDSNR